MSETDLELVEAVEVEDINGETVVIPTVVEVKEPVIHQVGRFMLGSVMALMADRLANVAYDTMLKMYRARRNKI